jgi:hypothetical protein
MVRNPLLRRIGLGLVAGLVAACVPSATAAEAAATTPSRTSVVGFWAGEDISTTQGRQPGSPANYYDPAYRGALTPAVWEVLRNERVPLYLNMHYGRDFGPVPAGTRSDATALIRKANALGVPVHAWLVVPFEQGYWAYEDNARTMKNAVRAWASWKSAQHLRFASVSLDQEFSWQNLQTYIAHMTGGDHTGLSKWMSGNIDPAGQCTAFRTYRNLISWAHDHGIAVTAAQAPMIVDDLRDGDLALQDALDMTGSSPGYDQTYLMTYRSAVAQAGGGDPGSAYVAAYYADMRTYFGRTGQVSLGIGGEAPYDTLTPLVNDIRMLTGLGAKQIPVYSLETTVDEFGAKGLRTIVEAARRPMKGKELAAATKPTASSEAIRASSARQNTTATTLAKSHPRGPNTWPAGCGDLTVHPLDHHRP